MRQASSITVRPTSRRGHPRCLRTALTLCLFSSVCGEGAESRPRPIFAEAGGLRLGLFHAFRERAPGSGRLAYLLLEALQYRGAAPGRC